MRNFVAILMIVAGSSNLFGTQSEERFKEIFTAAGYSTVLGAAVGAAVISFRTNPEDNLRLIAMGASFGFFIGLGIGSYFALEPMWAKENIKNEFYLSEDSKSIILKPIFLESKFDGAAVQVNFLKF